ncbi:peptidase M50 [Pseudonocardia dioxanivorans CB1190]|uniref:Peptidase M50 n=1 Tax=Pseudonocardia dioxanivorans (strain ATCC 55486 / DSM 44775 / JCM 13855 / CB1190) TaxID=675635 RepID=F4CTB7_PSEUX|nr:site-2 protease family protein [Pseudonocardia dioxanivorans]AEA27342.1 peptidase M50 [Pseudonocardia dioxanivorans CB1190]
MSPWFLLLVVVTVVGGVVAASAAPFLVQPHSSTALTVGVVLLVLGGWTVSLCLHEFGHAFVAFRAGDFTVRDKGYLTLDIRRYTDVGLSFVLPILFLLIGGIPLPGGAVWINHGLVRSRAARSLVSLAGPATNLILGAVLTIAVATISMPYGLVVGLSALALIQVLAFVLNILPIPGLDGFGVIEPYLSDGARRTAAKVRPWAPLVIFVLLISLPVAQQVFFGISSWVFGAVGGNPTAASLGYTELLFWR